MKILAISFRILMFVGVSATCLAAQDGAGGPKEAYLSWSASQATKIHESWRVKGRVGGLFDMRVLDTDKSFNYKLRATLMSPEAVRAAARIEQINSQLSDRATNTLVAAEENLESLIVVIEIDPREGSGIVPNNWRAFLKPKGETQSSAVRGTNRNDLRETAILKGAGNRDYDYDVFIVAFPLKDENGDPYWKTAPSEIELSVGIYNKEGRVNWKVSGALRTRIENLSEKKAGK